MDQSLSDDEHGPLNSPGEAGNDLFIGSALDGSSSNSCSQGNEGDGLQGEDHFCLGGRLKVRSWEEGRSDLKNQNGRGRRASFIPVGHRRVNEGVFV